jgi:hypothetical protein
MSNTIDLTKYRNQAYLELCLELVADAYKECKKGNYEMVETHLSDILETFDREEEGTDTIESKNNIYHFPLSPETS